jgi:threonine synthase
MDVGDPSNMERLRWLLGNADVLRDKLGVMSVNDEQIRTEIQSVYESEGVTICPHTATASYTWRNMDPAATDGQHWILVSTAHPAKFETIVEPLIGCAVPLPTGLQELMSRPARSTTIEPALPALEAAMYGAFGAV